MPNVKEVMDRARNAIGSALLNAGAPMTLESETALKRASNELEDQLVRLDTPDATQPRDVSLGREGPLREWMVGFIRAVVGDYRGASGFMQGKEKLLTIATAITEAKREMERLKALLQEIEQEEEATEAPLLQDIRLWKTRAETAEAQLQAAQQHESEARKKANEYVYGDRVCFSVHDVKHIRDVIRVEGPENYRSLANIADRIEKEIATDALKEGE